MIFIDSFKLNKNYLMCMLFDVLWIVLMTTIWIITINIIFSGISPYEELSKIGFDTQQILSNYGALPTSIVEKAEGAYNDTQEFLFRSAIMMIIFFIGAILVTSLIKGAIWARVLKKKYNKRFIIGFLKLNYIWYIGWFSIIFITTFLPRAAMIVAIAIELMVMFILTPLLRVNFTPKKSIIANFLQFIMNFKKIIKLLVMLLLMWIVLQLIILFTILTSFTNLLAPLILLLAIWYVSWTRFYLKLVLE